MEDDKFKDFSTALIQPTYVGKYELFKGFSVVVTEKPRTIFRFFSKLLLGWVWTDIEQTQY